jgi:hypothetical protein
MDEGGRGMSRKLIAVLAVVSLVGAAPAATESIATPKQQSALVGAAKKCGRGYKHAVIGRQHKCLRRGQYCARSRDREYHRYGYHCHKADRNGDFHLA